MIEIKSQRSARGTVFSRGSDADGNDMFTATNYAGDVFYDNWDARGDGVTGWRKVDIQLMPDENGWQVMYAPYVAHIPYVAGSLHFHDKRNVEGVKKSMAWDLEPVGVADVLGVLNGREVVYPNAYGEGCHLVYRAQRHGVAKLVRIEPTSQVTGPFVFRAHLPAGWKVVRQGSGGDYELLPTGKKSLDTNKRTAFVSNAAETYAAPFIWRSGPEQAGTLTVTAEHVGRGVWELVKHVPAEWAREYPIDMDVTATSTLSSDGYLAHAGAVDYSNCASGAGTVIDTTATVMQNYHKGGASGTRNCQRPFMVFTNSVPPTATITSVTVKVAATALVKLNSGVNHTIVLTRFLPSNYASPAIADFSYTSGMPSDSSGYPSMVLSVASPSAYYEFTATNAPALANITKGGYSGWALRNYSICTGPSYVDLYLLVNGGTSYNSTSAGYVYFESANAGGSFPPQESIDYTMPPSGGNQRFMLMGVG